MPDGGLVAAWEVQEMRKRQSKHPTIMGDWSCKITLLVEYVGKETTTL